MRKIVRDRILKKYDHKCVHCNTIKQLEVDHIIPLSRGGMHNEDNFQILCKACNLKKGQGIDYSQFFKIGLSPNYILIKQTWAEVLKTLTAKENQAIIIQMFKENDTLFHDGVG